MKRIAAALALFLCTPAFALDLTLPANARVTAERTSAVDSYALPIGPFVSDGVPTVTVEGAVQRSAWRIASPGLTTLQVMAPLRDQLKDAGYEVVLDCDQNTCGGFDFRFATEVLPAPNMQVNVRAFRFVSAVQGDASAPRAAISVMVSTSATVAHAQIITAGTPDATPTLQPAGVVPVATLPQPESRKAGQGVDQLLARGAIILTDLDFEVGTSDLGAGPFDVLRELASLLQDRSDIRLALVGHTDSQGSLEGNIALSKRRAEAVRQRMIDAHGADPARLDAEGMGYLSPAASHLTPEGAEINRRVEVIVLPAE